MPRAKVSSKRKEALRLVESLKKESGVLYAMMALNNVKKSSIPAGEVNAQIEKVEGIQAYLESLIMSHIG
jgi:hypothetical protein